MGPYLNLTKKTLLRDHVAKAKVTTKDNVKPHERDFTERPLAAVYSYHRFHSSVTYTQLS